MVQLDEKDALITAELHGAVDDRDGLASTKQQMLQVGMAVGRLIGSHVHGAHAKVIVVVSTVAGGDFLQEVGHIFK